VAHKAFVEDRSDRGDLIATTLREPPDSRAFGEHAVLLSVATRVEDQERYPSLLSLG